MATLRNKVYKRVGTTTMYVPLVRGENTLNIVDGADDGQLAHTVKHGADVTSQGLLEAVIDLIENDKAINYEINGINRIISEGVLPFKTFEFDFVYSATPSKTITCNGGAAKLHESAGVYGVYQVDDPTVFNPSDINTSGWYRRDLINIVFKDTEHPELVPYLEYITGIESSIIPPRHTLANKVTTVTKNSYPLWSVLFYNSGGTTIYVEHDQIWMYGGYKETVKLIHTLAFKKTNKGYYARDHEAVTFTDPSGVPIPLSAGASATSYQIDKSTYDIETICSNDPTGKLTFQEPDIYFRSDLANGDLLTFPFRLEDLVDSYAVSEDVELNQFTIALDKDTIADEGIELQIYTAKYFVNSYNNGIVPISASSVGATETILTLGMDISTFVKITGNNIEFETPAPWTGVTVGDFVFVFYGKGLYQTSQITSIIDDTHIKIRNLPIPLNTTSKVLIYKYSTIALAGQEITTEFLDQQTYDDKLKFEEKYPNSSHTGVSSLAWYDATHGYQEFGLTSVAPGVNTGLTVGTYYFKIAIDGGSIIEYSISVSTTPYLYSSLISDMNTAIANADMSILQSDIRCTSESVGPQSTISMTPGTTGTDLFTALSAPRETAVAGLNITSGIARAKGTVNLLTGHDWSSVNQNFQINVIYNGTALGLHTITLDALCTTIDTVITHINAKFTAAGINDKVVAYKYIENTIAFKTVNAGADQGFILVAGTPNALATIGILDATYKGQKPDIEDGYIATPSASTRLFYHMPTPPGVNTGHIKTTFPFKLRLNYNQWYFARSSIRDRNIPYSEYGSRPKIVVLDPDWAKTNSNSINGYLQAQINTNKGLYPYTVDSEVLFKLEDDYGDITEASIARSIKGFPAEYILHSKNLNGAAFVLPTESGHAYVDVMNGIVTFKDSLAEMPENLYLTYYYNSIITGKLFTDRIQHEKADGEIWNLEMLIQQLMNPEAATKTGSTTAIIDIAPFSLDADGSGTNYDFQPGTVIRYDINTNTAFGWCKAIATNFHYAGDAMVLERINDHKFKIIQLGYIDSIGTLTSVYTPTIKDDQDNNLSENVIYYLSPTVAGKITKYKPNIAQPILFTLDNNDGYGVTKGIIVIGSREAFLQLFEINAVLSSQCEELSNQVDLLTQQTTELLQTVNFMNNRTSQNSNFILEAFANKENTSRNFLMNIANPAEIMDENDYNNNWKEMLESSLVDFKQGFLRPRRMPFMGEVTAKYDLTTVGYYTTLSGYKAALDYDAKNQCYWFISNFGANAVGMIHKLTLDGTLNQVAYWYLQAGGASSFWTGLCSDGDYLYVILSTSAPTTTSGKVCKIKINSDGTLGTGNIQSSNLLGSSITNFLTSVCTAYKDITDMGLTAGVIPTDVTVWDSTHVAVNVNMTKLVVISKTTLDTKTPDYTYFFETIFTASTTTNRSFCRKDNMFYWRTDDTTLDLRKIYLFNLDTDFKVNDSDYGHGGATNYTARAHSGIFQNAIDVDGDGNGGICVDQRGDLLEVISTASNGKLIAQHAIANAVWAENQTRRRVVPYGSSSTDNRACYYDNTTGYLWYTITNGTLNSVYIVAQNPLTHATVGIVQVTAGNWLDISGITMANYNGTDYVYLVGIASGPVNASLAIPKATLWYAMTHSPNTIDFTVAGDRQAFVSFGTDYQVDLTSDGEYLYVINDTQDKIERWNISDAPTKTAWFISLGAAVTYWNGIAYANGKFFVFNYGSTGPSASNILVISRDYYRGSNLLYVLHNNKTPFDSWAITPTNGTGMLTISDDGILYQIHGSQIRAIDTLEDPYAMQISSFITSTNILASADVKVVTQISDRYFDPSLYSDIRNIPDKSYMCIGYGNSLTGAGTAGFDILNLDSFLNGKSSAGMDRFDVSKIGVVRYLRNTNFLLNDSAGTAWANSIIIEKDMIIVGVSIGTWEQVDANTTTNPKVYVIDLKNGRAFLIDFASGTSAGFTFVGSLSQRNEAKGYSGNVNTNLSLSYGAAVSVHIPCLSVRTFTKEDLSDFSFTNPRTYIGISQTAKRATAGGCIDILQIDWDSNGNRTPVMIYHSITGTLPSYQGSLSSWIAPSGYIFLGTGTVADYLYQHNKKVWELQTTDELTTNTTAITSVAFATNEQICQISQSSLCFKTLGGIWKHFILFGTEKLASAATATPMRLAMVDVSTKTTINIYSYTTLANAATAYIWGELFEDRVFLICRDGASTVPKPFTFLKRLKFDDNYYTTLLSNYWSVMNAMSGFVEPYYSLTLLNSIFQAAFSPNKSILGIGSSGNGVQLFHLPHLNQCVHESVDFICDNPKFYYYNNTIIKDGSD